MRRILAVFVFLAVAGGASSGWAQDRTAGVGVGFVKPSDVDGTFWLTANAQFKVAKDILVEPELGFWKKTSSFGNILDISFRDLDLGANALYTTERKSLRIHAGVGLGAHLLKGAVGVLGFSDSDSATKIGVHFLAGAVFGHAKGANFFANVRYDLVSDLNQFKIYGGVRFKI
jgi:hypothetical protein